MKIKIKDKHLVYLCFTIFIAFISFKLYSDHENRFLKVTNPSKEKELSDNILKPADDNKGERRVPIKNDYWGPEKLPVPNDNLPIAVIPL